MSEVIVDVIRVRQEAWSWGMTSSRSRTDVSPSITLALGVVVCTRAILLIGCIAAFAACKARDEPVQTETTTAAPNVVSLTATEYSIQAPETVPGGWTTFRLVNQGEEVHYGHIVQLEPGRTVGELVDAYAEAIRTSGPRPKWVKRFGGPGGTAPGDSSSVTQYLEPGSYVWICPVEDSGGNPHFAKGEAKPFVVGPADPVVADRGAAPKAGVVIRLMDFSFAVDTPLRVGRHTIRVENAGVEPHDLVLMKLAPGRTLEDVRTSMNPERPRRADQTGAAPSLESLGTLAGGIAVIAPGMQSFFDATFSPGKYVLICMTTAPDGRSHIEHGMIQQVSVR
ncbi:MAG TPA: hypothetical protein VES88_18555 [Gemmatimonadaceae bacterium]|nr:hypothetical protein [Gemmatimonadaceae bacterium]